MAKIDEPYVNVMVESFEPSASSGKHGKVHIRPLAGQGFDQNLYVDAQNLSRKIIQLALNFEYVQNLQIAKVKGNISTHLGGGQLRLLQKKKSIKMTTYSAISKRVKEKVGFVRKTCWIAHVLSDHNLTKRTAPNRFSDTDRTNPCPANKRPAIEDALRHLDMI